MLFIGAKGVITLPLLVYDKAIQEFDYTAACVIAVVNIALSLGLYSLYRLILSRFGGPRCWSGLDAVARPAGRCWRCCSPSSTACRRR